MEDTRKIVIRGIKPYDGEYPLEDRAFNTREWHWIKTISGYMPFTVGEGERGGDPDLFVALSVIAMERAGKIERADWRKVAEILSEVPFDGVSITVYLPAEAEEDEAPLGSTSEPATSSDSRPLERQTSSGEPSRTDTAPSENTPASTGTSGSPTSPESGLTVLAS